MHIYDGQPVSFIQLYVYIKPSAAKKWEGIGKRSRRPTVGKIIEVDACHKQNIGMFIPRTNFDFIA